MQTSFQCLTLLALLVPALLVAGCGADPIVSSGGQPAEAESLTLPPQDAPSTSAADGSIATDVGDPRSQTTAPVRPPATPATDSPSSLDRFSALALPFIQLKPPTSAAALRAEASELMAAVVKRLPKSADAWETKARLHYLVGEMDAARKAWENALSRDPDYGYAHLGLGKLARKENRLDEAVEHLSRASVLLPELEETAIELAQAKTLQSELTEAAAILEAFLQRVPDAAEAHLTLGQTWLALRDYPRAEQAFRRTLELRPEAPRAMEGLGKSLLRMGQREEARRLLEKQAAVRQATESSNRTPEEAFRDEQRDIARLYVTAGRVLVHHDHLDAAQRVFHKAVLLDKHNMDAWELLLRVLQQLERFDLAYELAQTMCRENPDEATAHLTLALLAARVGRTESAISSMEQLLKLRPQDAAAHQMFARLLVESRSDFPRALRLAYRAVELRGSASDHEMYAQTLAANGQFEKARQELQEAIRMDPTNGLYQGALQRLDAFMKSQQQP